MAMIPCPECGKEMSDSSGVCPSCGYQRVASKQQKKLIKIAIILQIIVLILFSVVGTVYRGNIMGYRYETGIDLEADVSLEWAMSHPEKVTSVEGDTIANILLMNFDHIVAPGFAMFVGFLALVAVILVVILYRVKQTKPKSMPRYWIAPLIVIVLLVIQMLLLSGERIYLPHDESVLLKPFVGWYASVLLELVTCYLGIRAEKAADC